MLLFTKNTNNGTIIENSKFNSIYSYLLSLWSSNISHAHKDSIPIY